MPNLYNALSATSGGFLNQRTQQPGFGPPGVSQGSGPSSKGNSMPGNMYKAMSQNVNQAQDLGIIDKAKMVMGGLDPSNATHVQQYMQQNQPMTAALQSGSPAKPQEAVNPYSNFANLATGQGQVK